MFNRNNVVTKNSSLIDRYQSARMLVQLTTDSIARFKEQFIKNLEDKKKEIGDENDPDYKILELQKTALQNGWTIEDMPLIEGVAEAIYDPRNRHKDQVEALEQEIKNTQISNSAKRAEMLGKLGNFGNTVLTEADELANHMIITELARNYEDRFVNWAEYPEDPELEEVRNQIQYTVDKTVNSDAEYKATSKAIRQGAIHHLRLSEEDKRKIRDREDYVLPERNHDTLENPELHMAKVFNNITVTNREAVKRVIGEEVYDTMDEAFAGTAEERTVKIHHSTGNRYMKAGKRVLEIDIAGSGFNQARREHNGLGGKVDAGAIANAKVKDPALLEALELQYGKPEPNIINGKTGLDDIRHKTTEMEVNGQKVLKDRYTVAGPLGVWAPGMPVGSGNNGDYSIENTTEYIKQIGTKYLKDVFNEWEQNPESVDDIHINMSGHSRGGVGCGEGMREIQTWLQSPPQNKYKDKIHFHIIQMDPVPGLGSWNDHPRIDYSKESNTDGTVIYSLTTEYSDQQFTPQEIYGAGRVIIGTTLHAVGLNLIDFSQMGEQGDEKAHRVGYYDAETQEYYRGSGLNDLPDGLYFADDNQNLIRLSSYAQLDNLIDQVMSDGASRQVTREAVIRNVAKRWFLDNELKTSYDNEAQHANMKETKRAAENRLLDLIAKENGDQEMLEVKKAIRNSMGAERDNDKDKILEQYDNLISKCKDYISKTPDPISKEDKDRMHDVSDLLALVQREKNYINNGLNPKKEYGPEKIGLLTRQQDKVAERIQSLKEIDSEREKINRVISNSARRMNGDLKGARKNSNKTYFDNLKKALDRFNRLGDDCTIRQFQDAYEKLKEASQAYQRYHVGYGVKQAIGFEDKDPIDTLAKTVLRNTQKSLTRFNEYVGHLGNKDISIRQTIAEQEQKERDLKESIKLAREKEIQQNQEQVVDNQINQIVQNEQHEEKPQVNRINLEQVRAQEVHVEPVQKVKIENQVMRAQEVQVAPVQRVQNANQIVRAQEVQFGDQQNQEQVIDNQNNQEAQNAQHEENPQVQNAGVENENNHIENQPNQEGNNQIGDANVIQPEVQQHVAENPVNQANVNMAPEQPQQAVQQNVNNQNLPYSHEDNQPGGIHFRRLQDMVTIYKGLKDTENGYTGHDNSTEYDNMISAIFALKNYSAEYIKNDQEIPAYGTAEGDKIRELENTAKNRIETYLMKKPKTSFTSDAGQIRQDLAYLGYRALCEGPEVTQENMGAANQARAAAAEQRAQGIEVFDWAMSGRAGINGLIYAGDAIPGLENKYNVGSKAISTENKIAQAVGRYNNAVAAHPEDGQPVADNLMRLIKHPEAVDEFKDMLDTKHHARYIRWNSGLYNDTKDAVKSFQKHRNKLIKLINKQGNNEAKIQEEIKTLTDRYQRCCNLLPRYESKVLKNGQDLTDKSTDAGFARAVGVTGLKNEFLKGADQNLVLNAQARNKLKKVKSYNELFQQEMAKRTLKNKGGKHRSAATFAKKGAENMRWMG